MIQGVVIFINTVWYIKYQGKVVSLADFAREHELDYQKLRRYAQRGTDLSKMRVSDLCSRVPANGEKPDHYGGYTMEDLADLYSRFRGSDGEMDLLSDFSGIPKHRWGALTRLKNSLDLYIEKKRRTVQGK